MLIINADDWGRSVGETDSALECFSAGRVTSVSAMVFMEDSQRAAELAIDADIPVGLHLNVCERFSGSGVSDRLAEIQSRVVKFVSASKYAPLLYNPKLRRAFEETCNAQNAEFLRLYRRPPTHVDGHRHKHLSMNVLLDGLIPRSQRIRRGFYFWPGEKGALKRAYRWFLDQWLVRRYRTTDYFFALSQCLETSRLEKVLTLARSSNVELMTHPVRVFERKYLLGTDFGTRLADLPVGSYKQI